MTKVLHISQYYAPRVGGVEKHLLKLNRELSKNGHQITVLTGNDNPDLAKREQIEGVDIYRIDNLPAQNYKLKIWQQIIKQRKLLKQADIIQIHDVFWWIIPLYPLIFHKIFITFHGHESSNAPNRKAIFWHKVANRFSQGSIAVGGFHEKYYQVKANYLIYGASETNVSNKKTVAKNKIIFVGRLIPETGILTYLQALKILKDLKHNYHLDVFGDGPLMNQAKNLAKKLQLSVTFHGTVAEAETKFNNYQIAFAASYLSICEALKQNCRVIAHYHNQFIKDYLNMSIYKDYIFISNNAQKIAKAIIKAPKVKKLDQKTKNNLSWSVIAKTYQELWQKK